MFTSNLIKIFLFYKNIILTIVQNDPMSNLTNRLGIIIVATIIAYFSRFILVRFMNRWMMTKSSKVDKSSNIENSANEIKNNQKLSFEHFNSESDITEIATHRKTLVERAKKMMIFQYTTDLLIIAVYAIAGAIAFSDSFILTDSIAMSFWLFVLLFLIWASLGQIGYRHQFTAYKNGVFDVIAPLWKFIFAVFQSKWKFLISLSLFLIALFECLLDLSIGLFSEGLPMLFAIIFHIFMVYRLNKKARKQPNIMLLILRVFLIKKTSLFTFSQLAKFWKHFGSYFTVADPSFYKVYWKRNFKRTFPVFIIIVFLFYTQLENNMDGNELFGGFIALMLIGAIIFIIASVRGMKRNFVKNSDALQKELDRLNKKPVKLDGTFKETPISCYDNTWQLTVDTLVKTASVVLMDLRGFSEKNKGCEFEVNLLLNKTALNRILFIGYENTIPLIKSTIERKYETLETSSPNIGIENPIATIFEVKKENNKETQYIMDILLNKALS